MTFAEYMEQALYGPEGYYSSGSAKSGKAGDYFTAPDVGAVFGQLLAEIFMHWRKTMGLEKFTLVEVGEGYYVFAVIPAKAGTQYIFCTGPRLLPAGRQVSPG